MEASRAAFLVGLGMLIVGLFVVVLCGNLEEVEPGHYVFRGPSAILVLPALGVVLMIAGAAYHFVWGRQRVG